MIDDVCMECGKHLVPLPDGGRRVSKRCGACREKTRRHVEEARARRAPSIGETSEPDARTPAELLAERDPVLDARLLVAASAAVRSRGGEVVDAAYAVKLGETRVEDLPAEMRERVYRDEDGDLCVDVPFAGESTFAPPEEPTRPELRSSTPPRPEESAPESFAARLLRRLRGKTEGPSDG